MTVVTILVPKGLTYREPFSDISRVKPPVGVDGFSSFLGVLQVALEHIGTLDAHLPFKKQARVANEGKRYR